MTPPPTFTGIQLTSNLRLLERLRFWAPPNPAEWIVVNDAAAQTYKKLEDVSSDIAAKEVELELLKRERYALDKQLQLCQCFYAPIRRLPYEILHEIFSLCTLESLLVVSTKQRMRSNIPPMTLERVCLTWHTLV